MQKTIKKNKNKTLSMFVLILFLFSYIFPVTSAYATSWQDLVTIGLGGIPIGKTSTYTYTNTGDASAIAVCMVNPQEPEINTSTTITCLAKPAANVVVIDGSQIQTVSKTYTTSGTQSVSFTFKLKNMADSENPKYGVLYATVNMSVYAGTTSTSTSDASTGSTSTTGTTGTTGNSTTGTSDDDSSSALNDLLNNGSDSLNSSDNDGLNSNNGTDDLNDYFNGVDSSADNIPGGLTDDLLGVGNNLDDPIVENSGEQSEPYTDGDNNNEQGEQQQSEDPRNLTMQDLAGMYKQGLAGLDGLTGENNGLLEAITGNGKNSSSLAQKLKDLMNGDSSVANNSSVTASDQDLFDVAKKLLLASGMNLEDIKNGKNYDSNSAYSEPTTSWDFNRITTLLKGRKVKLNGTTETSTQKKSGNINANANAKLTK